MRRLLAISLSLCLMPAASGQNPGGSRLYEARFREVVETFRVFDKRLSKVEMSFEALLKLSLLTDSDRELLKSLQPELDKARLEVETVRKELDRVSATVSKQGDDLEVMKGVLDKLRKEKEKLEAEPIKGRIELAEKTSEGVKPFTRVLADRVGGNMGNFRVQVELECHANGKKIPLGRQKLGAYYQVKNGDLKQFDEALTDQDGIVFFEFANHNWPRNTGVVFKFAGSETYRSSESRRMAVK